MAAITWRHIGITRKWYLPFLFYTCAGANSFEMFLAIFVMFRRMSSFLWSICLLAVYGNRKLVPSFLSACFMSWKQPSRDAVEIVFLMPWVVTDVEYVTGRMKCQPLFRRWVFIRRLWNADRESVRQAHNITLRRIGLFRSWAAELIGRKLHCHLDTDSFLSYTLWERFAGLPRAFFNVFRFKALTSISEHIDTVFWCNYVGAARNTLQLVQWSAARAETVPLVLYSLLPNDLQCPQSHTVVF